MTPSHLATRRAGRAPMLASLAVLVGAAACGASGPSTAPIAPAEPPTVTTAPATAEPSTAPASAEAETPTLPPNPTGDGLPLDAGTYRVPAAAWTVADYTVTVPDGWTHQYGRQLWTALDGDAAMGLGPMLPDRIWSEACAGSGSEPLDVGPSVDDLAKALDAQESSEASDPVPTTIGGHEGVRVDLTIPEGFDLHPCNVQDFGFQIAYSTSAEDNLVLLADTIASVHIVDVNGERQVFTTQVPADASAADQARLQAVLDSITYAP